MNNSVAFVLLSLLAAFGWLAGCQSKQDEFKAVDKKLRSTEYKLRVARDHVNKLSGKLESGKNHLAHVQKGMYENKAFILNQEPAKSAALMAHVDAMKGYRAVADSLFLDYKIYGRNWDKMLSDTEDIRQKLAKDKMSYNEAMSRLQDINISYDTTLGHFGRIKNYHDSIYVVYIDEEKAYFKKFAQVANEAIENAEIENAKKDQQKPAYKIPSL